MTRQRSSHQCRPAELRRTVGRADAEKGGDRAGTWVMMCWTLDAQLYFILAMLLTGNHMDLEEQCNGRLGNRRGLDTRRPTRTLQTQWWLYAQT